MKIEEQVTSFELSKRLKELGVKLTSFAYWVKELEDSEYYIVYEPHKFRSEPYNEIYSAFTVAELGKLLPSKYSMSWKISKPLWFCAEDNYDDSLSFMAVTEADARAKLLIYLIENNLLKL